MIEREEKLPTSDMEAHDHEKPVIEMKSLRHASPMGREHPYWRLFLVAGVTGLSPAATKILAQIPEGGHRRGNRRLENSTRRLSYRMTHNPDRKDRNRTSCACPAPCAPVAPARGSGLIGLMRSQSVNDGCGRFGRRPQSVYDSYGRRISAVELSRCSSELSEPR
jgi:hypothetical protein